MGTKVEGKRSVPVPGYFTMGHFNLITKGNNWSPYYEEKPMNSQVFYNEFANGYPCYDKEMLKQTILQHEATFRKQVYELHRLYKIQKDLMESYRRRDLEKFEGPMWNMQMQKPFSEFVTGAPTKDASGGLDLNEPGTDCSDMERSSVNYAGFQGIAEEGTSMNNYYTVPGEMKNGWKFTSGESNGHGKDMNGTNYIYPSTNFKRANGFISQHENNTATTTPWLKQEQTNSHTSTPVLNKSNAQCNVSKSENRCKRGLDLNLNESLPDEEPEIIVERKVERNFIDLNDSLPWTDELDAPSEVSTRRTELQVGAAKRGFEIDLEAPAACEEIIVHDARATAAAEAILAISASVPSTFDNSGNTEDTLAWFANVATSNRVEVSGETELDVSGDESSVESFEALALRLEESKLEERFVACVNSKEHVAETQDETAAHINRTMPRRGRRRQKKDFQKDILPGLLHLKKNEVTADLQIFGKVGPSRRVGRRPKKVEPDPVPVGPSCQTGVSQVTGEGLASVLGWGQITRRCRKQRLPPGKISFHSN